MTPVGVGTTTALVRGTLALLVAVVLPTGLSGCRDSLPTAPSSLETGIVIYEHANFQGASAHVTEDISDLADVKGPCTDYESSGSVVKTWDDCISSVRVAPGWRATLYRDDDYHDDSSEIVADIADLTMLPHDCPKGGLNDCVTSIRVRPR